MMMSADVTTVAAAFIAGFAGSAHCLGMCGGIAASIGMGTAGERPGMARALGHALLYNGARIASYATAGAIAGGIGLWLGGALHAPAAVLLLRGLTGAVLIAIGLQLAFGLRLLQPLESAGMHLWRRIAPLARTLMARRGALAALGLGALWGWLPCGLVYGMLMAAVATGDPVNAAGLMIAFGLGTAPAMVLTGAAGSQFRRLRQHPHFRRIAGAVVIALGLWTSGWPLYMALGGGAGH